jgi:hypothetical protein
MPQQIGQTYRSLIPTFSDAASIEEALKLYHYGVANYTSQSIPDDSIEGNFRKLKIQIDSVQTNLDNLQSATGYVRSVSQISAPNVITTQAANIIPLTVRGVTSQTASLQEWQNSASASIAGISNGGGMFLSNYLAVNSTTYVVDTSLTVNIGAVGHKGVVVRAASGQTANIQEWQNNGSSVLARIDKDGNVFSPNISGTTSVTSPKVTVSGQQTLTEFRVRNTYAGTSNPTGTDGQVGDIWFTYTP